MASLAGEPEVRRALVDTPVGTARISTYPAPESDRRASTRSLTTLVLGHGAGGGIEARDLAALAAGLPSEGVSVILVEQPWRVAGRRVAGPPAQLDKAWRAVIADPAVSTAAQAGRLVTGGRSAGARVACRTAAEVGAQAVVALAFPLHPPGRPERSRADELLGAGVPTLVVQGERDPFGGPAELEVVLATGLPNGLRVVAVPFADHGFAVPRRAELSQERAMGLLVESVRAFLAGLR
jgi:uncharacterized protein